MTDDEIFEAISHPTRVEILRILQAKPTRFADLKRKLKIDSSGLLDFHLKKMQQIITTDEDGNYVLNDRGYAAVQAVDVVSKHGWQRRSFIVNIIVGIFFISYFTILLFNGIPLPLYLLVIVMFSAWLIFYSYWSLVRRRVRIRRKDKELDSAFR